MFEILMLHAAEEIPLNPSATPTTMGVQERFNEQLINAIRDRQNGPERINALIEAGADVNAANPQRETPLILAVKLRDEHIINALIRAGANVNAANQNGNTPLIWAAESAHEHIVHALIRAGANVNGANDYGCPVLIVAVGSGNQKIVHALIRAGANVNVADQKGRTPLTEAAMYGAENIVTALIRAGANVNAADQGGNTPLTSAAMGGNGNIITAIQRAINERQAGRAYKEDIVRASTFAESARKLSGKSIPYDVNARILEALRPEVVTVQFLIGGEFITAEELSRWNVQWDGRRGMSDEERQDIYDRVDPIRVMKNIEANIPVDPT